MPRRQFKIECTLTVEDNEITAQTSTCEIVAMPYSGRTQQLANDRAFGGLDDPAPLQTALASALQLCVSRCQCESLVQPR